MAPETHPSTAAQFTEVREIDATILVEARYAGADNFTGAPLPGYEEPLALLRPAAARALGRVQRHLCTLGLGLKVWDAYRPQSATRAMVAWAEADGRAALLDRGYIARESDHNLGLAVDLTLVNLSTGDELDMGTPFDTFTEAAHTANAVDQVQWNRQVLCTAMGAAGFENLPPEWWHYRYTPLKGKPLDLPVRR
jgi:D-alanyl-D-alanine dipeptidase